MNTRKNTKKKQITRGSVSGLLPGRFAKIPRLAIAVTVIVMAASVGVLWWQNSRAASGDPTTVAWTGDFETCDRSQWDEFQRSNDARGQIIRAPVRQGSCAFKVEVQQADQNVAGSGTNQRTELVRGSLGVSEGKAQWYKWSIYIPEDFSSSTTGWSILSQWHGAGGLSPNIGLEFNKNTHWQLAVRGGVADQQASTKRYIHAGNVQRGAWADFEMHIHWASNDNGHVTLWINGNKVIAKTNTPTLYQGGSVKLKQGIYRSNHPTTAYVIHDGMRFGDFSAGVPTTPPPPTTTPPPVVPPPLPPSTQILQLGNIATGKAVTASSEASSNYFAAKVIDQIETENTSRWISNASDPEWVQVDLGKQYDINKISSLWVGSATKDYQLQTSSDGRNFFSVGNSATDNQTNTVNNQLLDGITARYVRFVGLTRWNDTYGHSLQEVGIYGEESSVRKTGDVDGDGIVNGLDLSAILTNYNKADQSLQQGELNGDGVVNGLDLSIVLSNYGK